ncbi:MAG: hypothetical protein KH111_06980 [Bacteroidales bacterium]|nr:hypothetical protein [Bacteroidales bacterium]
MNDKNDILIPDLPGEIGSKVQEMVGLIPSSEEQVCVVASRDIETQVSSLFAEILHAGILKDYMFAFSFIGNDEDISQNVAVNRAARNILVMDARHLLRGSDIALLDYIVSHNALCAGLVIMLLNVNLMPSVTEVMGTVKKVLEVKGIEVPVHVVEEGNTGKWLVQNFGTNPVNLDDVTREKIGDITVFVRDSLGKELSQVEQELETLDNTIARFKEHRKSFKVYAKQLDLTLWVKIQNYCSTHFDEDITKFAKEARLLIDKELHAVDIQKIQFYFSPYLNYLWGEFLCNEIKRAMDSVRDDMEYELALLTAKYKSYFGKEIEKSHLEADGVRAGNQPISFDSVDIYNNSVKNVVEGVIRNVIVFIASFHVGFLGYLLGEVVTNMLMKLFGGLLRIKRSDTELVQLYSEAVTQQFQEGLGHIKVQLKETLMPSLERNFKDSIREVKDRFLKNINELGKQYDQNREVLSNQREELKSLLDRDILGVIK